jgi:hypothetical protein
MLHIVVAIIFNFGGLALTAFALQRFANAYRLLQQQLEAALAREKVLIAEAVAYKNLVRFPLSPEGDQC